MADMYGRKFVYLSGLLMFVIYTYGSYTLAYTSRSLVWMYVFVFILGFSSSSRSLLGYVYQMELIPVRLQIKFGTALRAITSLVTIVGVLTLLYVTRDWT